MDSIGSSGGRGSYLAQALMAPIRGIQPSSMVSGRLDGQDFELVAVPNRDQQVVVDGHVEEHALEMRVREDGGVRHSFGSGLGGSFETSSRPTPGGRQMEGRVGQNWVNLTSVTMGAVIKIEGKVGSERVVLNQWTMRDGHILSGYIGNRSVSLQSRTVPGQKGLDSLDYLALLMPGETRPESVRPRLYTVDYLA